MLEQVYKSARTVARLRSGPIGAHLDGFVSNERCQGFSLLTIQEHLRVIADLNKWMKSRGFLVKSLTEQRIQSFLKSCRSPPKRPRHERQPLIRFLSYLREQGVIKNAAVPKASGVHSRLLEQFGDHLAMVRGLTPVTVARYQSIAHTFLQARFPAGLRRSSTVDGSHVSSFIVEASQQRGLKGAKELVIGLRAFLRWLQFRGWVTSEIVAAVPSVADWRMNTLPPALSENELNRLLRSCNRRTALGLRDYAVLLLLARLGLRAGEVVRLSLQAIDWRAGELLLQRKPGREERIPLPAEVGKSIASYLKRARPLCNTQRVFLCMNAPYRGFSTSSTVSSIVASALRRAGIHPERRGSHLLRHTLARTLLQKGATLSEIGELLGHREAKSTEVYARVDFMTLRALAHPWPKGGHR